MNQLRKAIASEVKKILLMVITVTRGCTFTILCFIFFSLTSYKLVIKKLINFSRIYLIIFNIVDYFAAASFESIVLLLIKTWFFCSSLLSCPRLIWFLFSQLHHLLTLSLPNCPRRLGCRPYVQRTCETNLTNQHLLN